MTLLERDRELAEVDAVLREGGVLVVEGGSGIGKTSLLRAAHDRAVFAGHDALRARGSALEADFAFGVVLQLFERRIADAGVEETEAVFAGAAAAARPLLSGRLGPPSGRDISFAVLHGLYWVAANLAARRPLLIEIDDGQWADAASLRWLAYLAPRIEGLRLSLLVAVRPGEASMDDEALLALTAHARVMQPALLTQTAVGEIVREVVGADADAELCAAAWHESGGNPFYLRELLRAADDPVSALRRPGLGLTRQVAARIQRLDRRALRFAQALAVLGDGCELQHGAAISTVDPDAAATLAAALVRLEVLAGDEPPVFLHPVLREALEASMDGGERSSAHFEAARLLHADRHPPGKVAAHLMRVRPAGDRWVVARLREGAEAAVGSGAPSEAADLLARALLEPPPGEDRAALLRQAAAVDVLLGRESACRRLEEALGLVGDRLERARIGLELGEAYANLYRWQDAVDVFEQTLAELGDADAALAGRLEAEMVVCGLRDFRRTARVLPVLDRLGDRRLEAPALEAYAVARAMADHMILGHSAEEVGLPLEAALIAAGPGTENWDLRLPAILTLLWSERFEAAEALLGGMLELAERGGGARALHVSHVAFGVLKLLQGALPEADTAARISLRILEGADLAQGLPLVVSLLGEVATEAGELAEAEEILSRVPADELTPMLPALRPLVVRARLRLAEGRAVDARNGFEAAWQLLRDPSWGVEVRDTGFIHIRSGWAQALLRLGDVEGARSLAEAELVEARAFGAPRQLGVALRVAGLARAGADGLALLEESVSVLRTSPALLERARSLAELGAGLRRSGHRVAARPPLSEALDLAARCGARPLAAFAREELIATGARPRRELRTGVEALTPSELRVARLAADGETNREIAQKLYLTVKTVEGHLARAYAKLEIEGRGKLAQGLQRQKSRVLSR